MWAGCGAFSGPDGLTVSGFSAGANKDDGAYQKCLHSVVARLIGFESNTR